MAETFEISNGDKSDKYALLYKQIEALVDFEKDRIAVMANVSAMIHFTLAII